jgi:hypothetical protein
MAFLCGHIDKIRAEVRTVNQAVEDHPEVQESFVLERRRATSAGNGSDAGATE